MLRRFMSSNKKLVNNYVICGIPSYLLTDNEKKECYEPNSDKKEKKGIPCRIGEVCLEDKEKND